METRSAAADPTLAELPPSAGPIGAGLRSRFASAFMRYFDSIERFSIRNIWRGVFGMFMAL